MTEETLICVDVETSGPNPGQYSILSIGACPVFDTGTTFYVELKPDRDEFQPEALAISGLDMEELKQNGEEPPKPFRVFQHGSRIVGA
jgi:DNA polymerase III epsilon subunit-like protein